MNPFPLILSSPSGGGKTTIAKLLLERRPDVGYSVSCTTRAPRPGEIEGVAYYFLSRADFHARVDRGEFAEWATVHGNLYGTLKSEVQRILSSGRHVVMDIDVQGARLFAAAVPASVLVFLLPPSVDVLMDRLQSRQTENDETMRVRLRGAREELEQALHYHYVVQNDTLEHAYAQVSAIIDVEAVKHAPATTPVDAGAHANGKRLIETQVPRLIAELERHMQP